MRKKEKQKRAAPPWSVEKGAKKSDPVKRADTKPKLIRFLDPSKGRGSATT